MKKLLAAMFVALLMAGCGEPDLSDPDVVEDDTADAVDWSKLQHRGNYTYLPNTQEPFSGYAKRAYENGKKAMEGNYKDGKMDGLWTRWYENGKKEMEGNYKDGWEDGLQTNWYKNGQIREEGNYKDGKLMSAEVWKFNGEKCPVTNLKDGNGVAVWYEEDGTEKFRETYKDGERVKD